VCEQLSEKEDNAESRKRSHKAHTLEKIKFQGRQRKKEIHALAKKNQIHICLRLVRAVGLFIMMMQILVCTVIAHERN